MQGSECNELISDMEQSSAALLVSSKLVLDLSGLQAPLQIITSWVLNKPGGFVMWTSFLQRRRDPICMCSSLDSPGNGVWPVMSVLAASQQASDWHPPNCSGVIHLFLFSSFPWVCQVLHICQSFHRLLMPICSLLAAA